LKDDERIKQGKNSEENGYLPKVQSKSSKQQSTLLHVLISASFLWYPFACLLIAIPFTLLISYVVSDEGLLYVVNAYLMACYLIPTVAFVVLLITNKWFRKSFLWILLLWFGTSQIGPMTQGALTRTFIESNKAIRAQLTKLSTGLEK